MIVKTKHKDGSETTIKSGPSKQYKGADLEVIVEERNKYSVIISSSVGCNMGCKMCGIKPETFEQLSSNQIIANVKEAIETFPEDLNDKYIKLCFMGMGEASVRSVSFSRIPSKILHWVIKHKYAAGVDSIDYGTILPKKKEGNFLERVVALNDFIKEQYKINPLNNHGSVVRVFFSFHSPVKAVRNFLIPAAGFNWEFDLWWLTNNNIDVILHYTLIDRVNDGHDQMIKLKRYMSDYPEYQLRMLRYNPNGEFVESRRLYHAWKYLEDLPNIKFQISPGNRCRAACGMFY